MVFCCCKQKGQKLRDNAEKLHPHHTSIKDRDAEIARIAESQQTWERVLIRAQNYSEQKGFWLIESSYSRHQEQKTYKNLYTKTCLRNRGQYITEWTEGAPFQCLVNHLPINKQLKENSSRFPFPLTPTKPNH